MQPPAKPQSHELLYAFDMVYLITYLYEAQLIGFQESRDLLEGIVTDFKNVRDTELDKYQTMTEQPENEELSVEDEVPDLP
jgi:hypothetical protein